MSPRLRLVATIAILAAIVALCGGRNTDQLSRFAPGDGYEVEEYGLNCFNHQTLNFDWTLELLTEESLVAKVTRSEDGFWTDTDLPLIQQVHPGDYANTEHDRGHGACSLYHRRTLSENASTFSMRNMMAQASKLNRGEWRKLEKAITGFVVDGNLVWVLTATVWHADSHKITVRTIGPKNVWVPTHCLKAILVRHLDGSYECKTWLIPNIDDVEPFDTYRVTAEYAQVISRLDLWRALPDDVEKKIEAVR